MDSSRPQSGRSLEATPTGRNASFPPFLDELGGNGSVDQSDFRIDARRRTDPEYRAGFNSEANVAPLNSTNALLLPGISNPPPPNTRP